MSAHTPGPWVYNPHNGTLREVSSGNFIAQLEQPLVADARLIAAAPELAEAGRLALSVMERIYMDRESVDLQEILAVIEIQRAALAKAVL